MDEDWERVFQSLARSEDPKSSNWHQKNGLTCIGYSGSSRKILRFQTINSIPAPSNRSPLVAFGDLKVSGGDLLEGPGMPLYAGPGIQWKIFHHRLPHLRLNRITEPRRFDPMHRPSRGEVATFTPMPCHETIRDRPCFPIENSWGGT